MSLTKPCLTALFSRDTVHKIRVEPYTEFGHAEAAGEVKRPGVCVPTAAVAGG